MAKTLKSKLIVIMLDHIKTVKLLVISSLEIISSSISIQNFVLNKNTFKTL